MSPSDTPSRVDSKYGLIVNRKTKDYFPSWNDTSEMEKFVNDTFGFMTSYTGTYETQKFSLTIGKCNPESKSKFDNIIIDINFFLDNYETVTVL